MKDTCKQAIFRKVTKRPKRIRDLWREEIKRKRELEFFNNIKHAHFIKQIYNFHTATVGLLFSSFLHNCDFWIVVFIHDVEAMPPCCSCCCCCHHHHHHAPQHCSPRLDTANGTYCHCSSTSACCFIVVLCLLLLFLVVMNNTAAAAAAAAAAASAVVVIVALIHGRNSIEALLDCCFHSCCFNDI